MLEDGQRNTGAKYRKDEWIDAKRFALTLECLFDGLFHEKLCAKPRKKISHGSERSKKFWTGNHQMQP
jgi:hypothetical protein